MDLRSYGIGAQILREVGGAQMQLLGQPRRSAQHGWLWAGNYRIHHEGIKGYLYAKSRKRPRARTKRCWPAHWDCASALQCRHYQCFGRCLQRSTLDLGVQEENITLVQVPGALEVPMGLMALAERDEFDALVALGCIIRGETLPL